MLIMIICDDCDHLHHEDCPPQSAQSLARYSTCPWTLQKQSALLTVVLHVAYRGDLGCYYTEGGDKQGLSGGCEFYPLCEMADSHGQLYLMVAPYSVL